MTLPLDDLSVLEASGGIAVRYCGRLFRQLGAKVVRASSSDDSTIGYAGECGRAYGAWLDEGKERVVSPGDATVSFDLVIGGQDADRAAEAQRYADRFGGTLLALTWFDSTGPYATWRATDEIIAALTGVAYTFGEPDGPPMLAQGHAPQITAGLVAFNAALAGLLARERPKRIDVNVFEAALCYTEIGALTGGAIRLGVNKYVPTYPSSPYRTADGWVGVTCLTPAQWASLCKLIERPDLALDSRFATTVERLVLSEDVDIALSAVFPTRTTDDWIALGDANRIPFAPMVRPGKLPGVPHWKVRGAFARFGYDEIEGPTLPYRIRFEGTPSDRWDDIGGEGPLSGLRVVDFSMGWAGPLCARTLGDLGADVVKIESENHPDWWRGWEASDVDITARESKINFVAVNRNKRGVDIDLTKPEGIARAKALIARADVVVENYAAGVLDKLSLGADIQRTLNPGIISLSMPAFGVSGPLSGLRAYGSTVEQASGLPFVNGEAHWAPSQQHVAFGDPIAGIYAASAILAALHGRKRLGGASIDLAQVACLFQIGADAIIAEQVLNGAVPRTGHRRARLPLCTVVRTEGTDRWVAVVAEDEDALDRLAAIISGGVDTLAKWAAEKDAVSAAWQLRAGGVAAAPLQSPSDLTLDEQLCASGFWTPMERAVVGHHLTCNAPFRFDGRRCALRITAPLLGEHTRSVLAEIA